MRHGDKMNLTWIPGVLALILTPLAIYGMLGGEGLLAFTVASLVGMFPSLLSRFFHIKTLSGILRALLAIGGIAIWWGANDIPLLNVLGISNMGLGMTFGLILTPWILHAFGSTDTAQAAQLTFRKKRIQKWLHLYVPEGTWFWIPLPLRAHKLSLADAQKAAAGAGASPSPTTASTHGTATPTSTEASNPLPWIIGCGAFIILVILALLFSGGSSDEKKEGAQKKAQQEVSPPSAQQQAISTQTTQTEVLQLMKECVTPCSTYINYKAQIWGDGPDFWVTFCGVKNPVLYSHGKFMAPDGVKVGETFFKATNPKQPVTIRIYRKIP